MNTDELVKALFEEFDRNGDGKLSRGEFVEVVRYLLGEHGIQTSSRIFERFDSNHDNGITPEELVDLIEEYVV
ncbi:MAG: EF-hand domain-containing protein [Wenzhouxiangella sp.]|jgi:Ca2+-binding EF-hand superfamily protein|nr:EF-hand domain-containing protein [Wenzhouxiangella sp.]